MEINTVTSRDQTGADKDTSRDHTDAEKESFDHRSDVLNDTSSVRSEALGDDLPKGYFYSLNFIGCLTVSDAVGPCPLGSWS